MEVGQLLTSSVRSLPSRRGRWLAAALASAAVLAACGNGEVDSSLTEATPPSSIDAQREVDSVPERAPELCERLTDELITDLTGASVVGISGEGETCVWSLTESAAVLGGPNEGGEASLEAELITAEAFASFEASEDPGVDVVPVDDIGDEAFLVRRDGLPPTTLFVLDGDRALRVALANVLDGGNATEEALTDLADEILGTSS